MAASRSEFPKPSPVKTLAATQGSVPPPAFVPLSSETPHPIDALSTRLGPSSQGEVRAMVAGTDDNTLIESGREVATARVTDDTVRVVTQAEEFFAHAPALLQSRVKLASDNLRVLAWSCAQGHHANAQVSRARASRRSKKSLTSRANDRPIAAARTERDQLAEALRGVAAGDAVETMRITEALAPSASGHPEIGPGRALTSLVAIGRERLASEDPGVRRRCEAYKLTGAWLDECAVKADAALAAERVLNAPVAPAVDEQATVDWWDGVNLFLIERVVKAFATAHASDRNVPKIQLVSLRGVIGKHKKRKGEKTDG